MSFHVGVIYPDDKGSKWIVLDRCGSVLLVCRMNSDDVFLAEDLDGSIAQIRKSGPITVISSKVTRAEMMV